jgi:hypothetical protein
VLNHFDPFTSDDFILSLQDDGVGCDTQIDGVFTACYENATNSGEWSAKIQAFNSNSVAGERIAYFLVDSNQSLQPVQPGTLDAGLGVSYADKPVKIDAAPFFGLGGGKPTARYVTLSTEKAQYAKTERIVVTAKPIESTGDSSVTATFDNGTSVYLDLPFVLPFLDTARIRTTNGVFISAVFVSGLLVSLIQGQFKRFQKQAGGQL